MLKFLLTLLVSIPVMLLRGLVLADILRWFFNVHMSAIQAVGISFIVGLFTYRLKTNDDDKIIVGVICTLWLWGFAYVWSLFL